MSDVSAHANVGRELTKAEHRDALAELKQWMSPQEMVERFSALKAITNEYFFIHGRNGFIKDVYIAAAFANARGAKRVRLGDDPPDFEIEVDGAIEKFEATEALFPGRRRGDKFRKALGKSEEPEHFGTAAINAAIAAVPVALRDVAKRKAERAASGRGYDPSWGLVILENCETFGLGQVEVEACFDAATEPARSAFREVWVLCEGEAYRTWPPGGPRPTKGVTEPADFDFSEIFDGN